jgi:TonB family protein
VTTQLIEVIVRHSVQIGVVIAGAALGAAVFRVASARVRLAYWHAVVVACLVLPVIPYLHSLISPIVLLPFRDVAFTVQALTTSPSHPKAINLLPVLLLVGALTRGGYLALGVSRLYHLRRLSAPIALDKNVESLARAIAPGVEFRLNTSITQPVTFGVRQPTILLPRRLVELPSDLQRAAVAHEAFHVVRRDWCCLLVEQVVQSLLWFHPAIWWAMNRIELSREETIDELVVRQTGNRHSYVTALLSFADVLPHVVPTAVTFLRRRHLASRVKAIVRIRRPSPRWSFIAATGLAIGLAVSVVDAASLGGPQNQRAEETVYDPGNGVTLPMVVSEAHAVYTDEAMAAQIEGTILMSCVVTSDGRVGAITVIRSLDTFYGLDNAAIDALRQWRFNPGTKEGKPVAVRVHVEMTFTLK